MTLASEVIKTAKSITETVEYSNGDSGVSSSPKPSSVYGGGRVWHRYYYGRRPLSIPMSKAPSIPNRDMVRPLRDFGEDGVTDSFWWHTLDEDWEHYKKGTKIISGPRIPGGVFYILSEIEQKYN